MGVFLQVSRAVYVIGSFRLNRPQTSVNTVLSNENFMGAVLDDVSLQNQIGRHVGRWRAARSPLFDLLRFGESTAEGGLGFVINGRRLVENEEGILEDGSAMLPVDAVHLRTMTPSPTMVSHPSGKLPTKAAASATSVLTTSSSRHPVW